VPAQDSSCGEEQEKLIEKARQIRDRRRLLRELKPKSRTVENLGTPPSIPTSKLDHDVDVD
jgi:hypothetical protein